MLNLPYGHGAHLFLHPPDRSSTALSDPKTISDEEYKKFYQSFFKEYDEPLAWQHFSGDSGSGVSFKAIVYIPSKL